MPCGELAKHDLADKCRSIKGPGEAEASNSKGKAVEPRDAEDSSEDMGKTSSAEPNGKGIFVRLIRWSYPDHYAHPVTSNPLTSPPVFWTEVFSYADGRWLPVDPIRAFVNKRNVFDPTPVGTTPRPATVDNRMIYVIAVEEDGYMRDVTLRYAKQYSAKVAKAQSGGKGRREWRSQVISVVTRPYRLVGDSVPS